MSTFHDVVRAEVHNGATLNQAMDHAAHVEQLHKTMETRPSPGSAAPTAPASLATGLLIWGLIAMMGNGEIALYLLGASALLFAIQAVLWIIYHPIRALIGLLLICGMAWYGFSHLRVDRNAPASSVVRQR